jgi:hypothetical protein
MKNLKLTMVLIFAVALFITACKKEKYNECVSNYAGEYSGKLELKNEIVDLGKATIQKRILDNEMDLLVGKTDGNGPTISFEVNNDCSFFVLPNSYIIKSNQDTIFVESGTGNSTTNGLEVSIITIDDGEGKLILRK